MILFSPAGRGPLFRIPATGGDAVAVTKVELPRQNTHRFLQFLPDGRQFLFYVSGTPDDRGIYLGSLDSAEARRLMVADSSGLYAPSGPSGPSGWLLFIRQGTLVARRFDSSRGQLMGDPVTVADSVNYDGARFSLAGWCGSCPEPRRRGFRERLVERRTLHSVSQY